MLRHAAINLQSWADNRRNFVLLCKIKRNIMYDAIVIGAGAAGLMAAAEAARAGRSVLLLEKMEKAGRKIRITGKGRCNLTNARPAEEFIDHVRANAYFFNVAFSEFNNRATIRFFERLGVKLDIERGEREKFEYNFDRLPLFSPVNFRKPRKKARFFLTVPESWE